MRRLIIFGATTAAVLAVGGTALASSGSGRHDDRPSHVVVSTSAGAEDNPSRGVDDNPTSHGTASTDPTASPTATPSTAPSVDDHGGLRTTRTAEPGDDHGGRRTAEPGDDHGGHGRGGDDRPGDDHGGSRHRR
ncbi:hypothetical protein ABT369_45845 [Dactylosporangium sp. NPDC000244]|uniref:hypothetical protein n=1 Tax=Dactylosporangium sp. NPDC000244 TaxID=3154365 RepID=UPI0033176E0B